MAINLDARRSDNLKNLPSPEPTGPVQGVIRPISSRISLDSVTIPMPHHDWLVLQANGRGLIKHASLIPNTIMFIDVNHEQ